MADPDTVKTIIQQVMEEKGIDPKSVPTEESLECRPRPKRIKKSKRYFLTRSRGVFPQHEDQVPDCHRTWSSAHAWSVMDLKEQQIPYCYWQKCKKRQCKTGVEPVYDVESITRMAEWACDEFLIRMGRKERPVNEDAPKKSTGPHDRMRCQMCRLLHRKCC